MKNLKLIGIIVVSIIAVILLCIIIVNSAQNKAIALEEQILMAKSDVKIQENAGLI